MIELPISVAYGTNLRQALQLMIEATNSIPNLAKEQKPSSGIKSFADSGINLSLNVWIEDPRNGIMASRTQIYLNILDLFNQHQIEIPFPRQDVKIIHENT